MKKLVLLALIAFAAWYGWKHYKSLLLERRPMHEAVVENQTGVGLTRVRLTVDGQTFVREELPDKGRASFPFRVGRDAAFRLVWQWSDRTTENLSVTFACLGNFSVMSNPGTLVRIGFHRPRYSAGASGFMS